MASLPGKNEGFRVLDEFVCRAVPETSALAKEAARPVGTVGENEGLLVMGEAPSAGGGEAGAEEGPSPEARTEGRLGSIAVKSGPPALRLRDLRHVSTAQLLCVLALMQGLSETDLWLVREVLRERLETEDVPTQDIEIDSVIASIDVSLIRRKTAGTQH